MTTPTPAKNRKYTKKMPEEAPLYERITGKNIYEVAGRSDHAAEAETLAEAAAVNRLAPLAAPGNRITSPARRNCLLRAAPPGGRFGWR